MKASNPFRSGSMRWWAFEMYVNGYDTDRIVRIIAHMAKSPVEAARKVGVVKRYLKTA